MTVSSQSNVSGGWSVRADKLITLVGAHAEGEIGKVITGGVLDIPGSTMQEKLKHIATVDDSLLKFCLFEPQDAPANGLTLCTGSLGANPANDIPAIAEKHAKRIHFVHLRNVRKDPDGSFEEAAHLSGDTNMVAVCQALLDEERARRDQGRADHEIPFRPDHGHELLSDAEKGTVPGYPLIGRLRGLAEIRGVVHALAH